MKKVLMFFLVGLAVASIVHSAVTVSIDKATVMGQERVTFARIAFDSSYPAGGETLTAANLGLYALDILIVPPQDGYVFDYDYSNSKLRAFLIPDTTALGDSTAMIQVAATADLSGVDSVRVIAYGR